MDHSAILSLPGSERISVLKEKMLDEPRYVSIEQARIVTEVYQQTEGQPPCIRRARALQAALTRMSIRLEPEERIVGNRTPGVRAGVVFPETGASWVDREFETLPTRAQDRFQVRPEDITEFRTKILPYWKGRSLEGRRHCKGRKDQPEGSFAGPYLPEYGEVAPSRPRRPARTGCCASGNGRCGAPRFL